MKKFNPSEIEKKWQSYWQEKELFFAKDFSKKPKKYVLVEFPYPSGEGLHMGHLRPYVAADVYARHKRMRGEEVMFPIGWDAFGLPAENFAIKMGEQPSVITKKNIANAKRQMLSWGLSFDWSREINTTDPTYYKWTQWLFLQFFKHGLAYEATGMINWCPKDKTGLANEEVVDGKCERCGTKVEKKEMRQWYLKITAYAEKLLQGLKNDLPKWPEQVRIQQENWIGKSEGAEINFFIADSGIKRVVILHCRQGSPTSDFYQNLKQELESKGFEVQIPVLPNTEEPDDEEQADFAMKNCKFDEQTVVLGHSFGGVVALRLLERGIKVHKTVLISVPSSGKFLDGKVRLSVVKALEKGFDFKKIRANSGGFVALYDLSDQIVPLKDGEAFAKNLGISLKAVKAEQPHFHAEVEPEILPVILPSIKIFTTRPDTIFGATYMVVAPEHSLIENFKYQISNFKEVQSYVQKAKAKSEMDRTAEGREKTGVELKGLWAINPATKEEVQIWVADYVLWGYGTGAIMAVPAHDFRDHQFAVKYNLPIIQVIKEIENESQKSKVKSQKDNSKFKNEEQAFVGNGILINSGKFNGMKSQEAIPKMAEEFGKPTVQYKLRDWVFSRQRYWGEPIPIIHCEDCGNVAVPDKDLPVLLPQVKKYEPTGTGESPLAAITNWLEVKCPNCGKLAWRETNTMPQWAGSSWYWLRYADPQNQKEFASLKNLKYWQPVDVYFGGLEHTTLHLLYARFWNLFLFNQNLVTEKEPFVLRKPHGIILAADNEKMSKSRGNVVSPDEIVKKFGADTLRMYELFLGPHEMQVSWGDQGIMGVKRFLDRVWEWAEKTQSEKRKAQNNEDKAERSLHRLIKKITEDIENFRFNTAVSAFMEFLNQIKGEPVGKDFVRKFLILLYPFAPHMCEELNELLGSADSLQKESWPTFDPAKVQEATVEIVVQINGKVKAKLQIPAGSGQDAVQKSALELPVVKAALVMETVKRVVFVKDRLINLVI